MAYTTETIKQIWNDSDGSKFYVGPDRDGLELVEVSFYYNGDKADNTVVMERDAAILVARAILELYDKLDTDDDLK